MRRFHKYVAGYSVVCCREVENGYIWVSVHRDIFGSHDGHISVLVAFCETDSFLFIVASRAESTIFRA